MGALLYSLVIAAVVISTEALAPDSIEKKAFDLFKIEYNKVYETPQDELQALKQFIKIYRFIEAHNKKFADGLVEYSVAINRFADLSKEEVRKITLGSFLPEYDFGNSSVRPKDVIYVTPDMFPDGPDSIDWKALGR